MTKHQAPNGPNHQHLGIKTAQIFTPLKRQTTPTTSTMFSTTLLILLIIFTTLDQHQQHRAQASGVFELELIDLQRFDSSAYSASETRHERQRQLRAHQPIRLLVCLKEAFTSQLDEPCTFGNASITIDPMTFGQQQKQPQPQQQEPRDRQTVGAAANQQLQQQTKRTVDMKGTEQHQQEQLVPDNQVLAGQQNQNSTQTSQQQQQLQQHQSQQQGSLSADVVRILFTFRWTKSFTIILSTEQISTNDQLQQQPTVNRPQIGISGNYHQRRFGGQQINSSNKTTTVAANYDQLPPTTGTTPDKSATEKITTNPFIDRHVLTENEVLPNLESNPNKPWTSRFSRSLKSSLSYRFRVFCALNYYGDGCTTFCRPRDDQFGHYNCSSTGQKVCFDGWHGSDCDKAKCRPGCNQQHGFCDKPDTCQCRPGWTGIRCDECITYPGCQNGYCLSPWQCICQRNWGGVLCDQDLNVCGTRDLCENNGTCQNVAPGRYKCHCSEGFSGVNCETSLNTLALADGFNNNGGFIGPSLTQLNAGCAMNPCLNGGTCYEFNSQLVDSNRQVVSAPAASFELAPIESSDHILQTSTEQSVDSGGAHHHYRCQCSPGWTGDYCQKSDGFASPAQDHQLIMDNNSSLLVINASISESASNVQQDETTTHSRNESSVDETIIPELITTILEPHNADHSRHHHPHQTPTNHHLDMKHLISGVVIASVVGVFMASLLLAWCCLMAIERNRFSFIQMNIIRSSHSSGMNNGETQHAVGSTLRRMQEKLRNSLRCSSRIKPETKLSIENVLKAPVPPPSYEESSNNNKHNNNITTTSDELREISSSTKLTLSTEKVNTTAQANSNSVKPIYALVNKDNLVKKRGALEQEMAHKKSQSSTNHANQQQQQQHQFDQLQENPSLSSASPSCPWHGRLHREQDDDLVPATTIEIEYQPNRLHHHHQPQHNPVDFLETNDQLRPHEHYHYPPSWA